MLSLQLQQFEAQQPALLVLGASAFDALFDQTAQGVAPDQFDFASCLAGLLQECEQMAATGGVELTDFGQVEAQSRILRQRLANRRVGGGVVAGQFALEQ